MANDASASSSAPPSELSLRAGRSLPAVTCFVAIALSLLIADLALKYWAFRHVAGEPIELRGVEDVHAAIPWHEPIVVVPKILSLQLTVNTGAVFGLGKGAIGFFVVVSVIATVAISVLFARSAARAWLHHVALAMILSGALGNLYDRVFYNAVRDMLHLFPGVYLPGGLAWPGGAREVYPWIFNIADVALVVGVLLLITLMWRDDRQTPATQTTAS